MRKDDKTRLSHMLSAAREAQAFVGNKTRASIHPLLYLISKTSWNQNDSTPSAISIDSQFPVRIVFFS